MVEESLQAAFERGWTQISVTAGPDEQERGADGFEAEELGRPDGCFVVDDDLRGILVDGEGENRGFPLVQSAQATGWTRLWFDNLAPLLPEPRVEERHLRMIDRIPRGDLIDDRWRRGDTLGELLQLADLGEEDQG